jgi:endonuclease YncB( thermonuclease family)
MMPRRVVIVFAVLLCAASAKADSRIWADASGKFHREAELADFQNGHAYLKEADGRTVSVALSRLSSADRDFIKATVPAAKIISGKVVGITDGDTFTVLDSANQQYKIRLEGIDAPESHQAYGTQSRKALSEKVFEKHVTVEWREKDKYGRTLGNIFLDDRWINKDMVQEGWAWHYREYSKSEVLADAESEARTSHSGLWQDDKPIAPWDFRHPPVAAPTTPPSSDAGAPDQPTKQQTVYITKTGTKYHNDGCRHLSKSRIPISLNDAAGRYSPCSVCHPPTAKADKPSEIATTSSSGDSASETVGRQSVGETVTGQTATGIPTYTGPRGGQYHYSKSGKKVYEKKK